MSHFVAIKTSVRDVNALRKACEELGLELLESASEDYEPCQSQ